MSVDREALRQSANVVIDTLGWPGREALNELGRGTLALLAELEAVSGERDEYAIGIWDRNIELRDARADAEAAESAALNLEAERDQLRTENERLRQNADVSHEKAEGWRKAFLETASDEHKAVKRGNRLYDALRDLVVFSKSDEGDIAAAWAEAERLVAAECRALGEEREA
jgi:hypothetical protein